MSASRSMDVAAAGSLGVLLGILMGLSASPIVAAVATALVALLSGLFGFSEKISPNLPSAAARRIVAFGLAAIVATPLSVFARTHDWLGPSIQSQRAMLTDLGIREAKEQNDMLRFLRFGILPPGTAAVPKDSPTAPVLAAHQPVLFAGRADFCSAFLQLSDPNDLLSMLDAQGEELKAVAAVIRKLPDQQQRQALSAGRIYLCKVP